MWLVWLACTDSTTPVVTSPTTPTVGPYCGQDQNEVPLDEVGPVGISAQEALAGVVGTFDSTFVYRDGTETPLTLALTLVEVERWEHYPLEAGEECPADVLVAQVEGEVSTGDGAFVEVPFEFPIVVDAVLTSLSMSPYVAEGRLEGSYVGSENMSGLSVPFLVRDDGTTSGELVELRVEASAVAAVTGTDPLTTVECGIGAWGGPLLTDCP